MKRYLQFISLLLLATCFVPLSAHADDDVKRLIGGVALGIVGHVLDNAEQKQQEQPMQNSVTKASSQQPSKPKLTYDADVADAQEKLKALGHYNGVVDGLKGGGTTSAIKAFEESKGYGVDGVLSQAEHDILSASVTSDKSNTDTSDDVTLNDIQTPSQTSQNASQKQIKDIEELAVLNHINHVCTNYRDIGHSYSFAVRDDFVSIYSKVSKLFKKRIKKQAKCLGIDDIELRQRRADKAYEESDDGKTITVGIAGAMGGVNSPDSASEYCNMSVGTMLIRSRKLEKEVFNKNTCEYE
jgi:peptidoglycan hydrolase-like protein with peptidoglycan-binding domain